MTNFVETPDPLKNGVNVLVFTDGESMDKASTRSEAKELQKYATVFSIHIGEYYAVQEQELKAISSDGTYRLLTENDIEDVRNEILSDDRVCGGYDCKNIFRSANPATLRTKGCSKATGQGQTIISK